MQGHQQSNTRKLNRHWQSGGKDKHVTNNVLILSNRRNLLDVHSTDPSARGSIQVRNVRKKKRFTIDVSLVQDIVGSDVFIWAANYTGQNTVNGFYVQVYESDGTNRGNLIYKKYITTNGYMTSQQEATLQGNGWEGEYLPLGQPYVITFPYGITQNRSGQVPPFNSNIIDVSGLITSKYIDILVQCTASTTQQPFSYGGELGYDIFEVRVTVNDV